MRDKFCIIGAVLLFTFLLCPSVLANTFTVTNTADSGAGSLRQAILDANVSAGPNNISFNIPTTDSGFDGSVFTIKPLSALPVVVSNITIDGSTQAAFTGDTNQFGPEVVINGSSAPGDGLRLDDNNIVKGLVINGFSGSGVLMTWQFASGLVANNNQVLNNFIGTDPTGTFAIPNNAGVILSGFASPPLQDTGNVIQNNLISGNSNVGITLCDTAQTQMRNNLIGTDRTGTSALGNLGPGIIFECAGAPNNLVEGNTIAFNLDDGVVDAPDYRFGVAFTPQGHQGNAIRHNSIFANGGLGINIFPAPSGSEPFHTPTLNDPCDADTGGNLLQNFPVVTSASSDGVSTTINGTLDASPNETFAVELFSNGAADPSGYGEGQIFLGVINVTTDSMCHGSFSTVIQVGTAAGSFITSTATDASGNTSEFSQALAVTCSTPTTISDISVSPSSLWPPNHKLVDVTVDYMLDSCDPSPIIACTLEVTSNEPVGATPDWEIVDAHHVRLRSERRGSGDGRIYTITVSCSDGAGQIVSRDAQVIVPHDQRRQ